MLVKLFLISWIPPDLDAMLFSKLLSRFRFRLAIVRISFSFYKSIYSTFIWAVSFFDRYDRYLLLDFDLADSL